MTTKIKDSGISFRKEPLTEGNSVKIPNSVFDCVRYELITAEVAYTYFLLLRYEKEGITPSITQLRVDSGFVSAEDIIDSLVCLDEMFLIDLDFEKLLK